MNSKYELFFAQSEENKANTITAYKLIENIVKSKDLHAAIFESAIVVDKDGVVDIKDGFKVVIECGEDLAHEVVELIKKVFAIEGVYVRICRFEEFK